MISDSRNGWRPWILVGLSFLALALAYSTRAAFGLVMPLLEQEFGWSRGFTSGVAAAALMMTAILAPFAGRLVDRRGARAVVVLGLAMLAAGCFFAAATSHPVFFLLAFGGVAATGFGLIAIHVVSTAVEQEFDANQGLAMGIATSGSTGGQLLVVPILAVLLSTYSWRFAFIALGVAAVVLMVGVIRWFPAGVGKVGGPADPRAGVETSMAQDI